MMKIIRNGIRYFLENDMLVYAGYATHYILLAALPLLMLLMAAVNSMAVLTPDDLSGILLNVIPDLPEIRALLLDILANLNSNSNAFIASIAAITALWSASNGISAMQKALKKISQSTYSFFRDKPRAIGYTLLFVIMILFQLLFHVFGSSLSDLAVRLDERGIVLVGPIHKIISFLPISGLVTSAVTITVLLLMYTYLPGDGRKMRTQIPGALFTWGTWSLFSKLFALFIPMSVNSSMIYGSLFAIFMLALWVWVIVILMFAGAILNKELYDAFNHANKKTSAQ